MKLRVKFSKHGNIRYIGHLDVMRYFQKANRRAGIDIKYSGGYSPHQIMSFAQPLSVGFESDGEYMDIEVGQIESTDQVKEALNSVMAEGIRIEEVKILPSDAKNAMASIAAASYYVRFKDGFCPAHDTLATIDAFMAQESIPYIKKTEKNEFELDLKTSIYELTVKEYEGTPHIYMMVNASSSGNLKPALVVEKLFEFVGEDVTEHPLHVIREDLYLNLGDAEHPEFGSLGSIGSDEIPSEEHE